MSLAVHASLLTLLAAGGAAAEGEGGLSAMFDVGQSSLIWTVVIFLLALPLMWKVVFGPITRALEERENQTREAAAAADAAREEVARMKDAIQADLDSARREAAAKVEEAKGRAEAREKEILASARAEAERDRARAKAEIDRALASAREVLRNDAVTLGLGVAEQVIGREFSDQDQARLLQDFQKEVATN